LSGIAEVIMFVVIAPPFADLPLDIWVYWYAAFTAHTLLAVLIITNRQALARPEDYERSMKKDIRQYKRWLTIDRRYASLLCLITFTIFVSTKYFSPLSWMPQVSFDSYTTAWLHTLIGFGLSLLSFRIILVASKQYQTLSEI